MNSVFIKIIVGLFVGIVSGFFGSGGGLLLVPYFSDCLKLDEQSSRATTIFVIFLLVITSSIFYIKENYYDWALSIKCILGGIVGSFIGTKLLTKLSNNILKGIFVIFLIYSGLKFIFNF